jgi:hypothetical protein
MSMTHQAWKKIGCAGVLSAVMALGFCFADYVRTSINRGRAKTTAARIARVSNYLVADQLSSVDPDNIQVLLRKYELPANFSDDAWGHPFIFEMWSDKNTGLRHYRVTALGRSGKRSACCRRWIHRDWDLNAVSQDAQWLQLWDF